MPYNSLNNHRVVTDNGIAYGYLSELPGCCGVVVSHGASVARNHQGKGVGKKAHHERLEVMRENLYTVAMCTVTENNIKQIHILRSKGWHRVHTFNNKKTGNDVSIWIKDL